MNNSISELCSTRVPTRTKQLRDIHAEAHAKGYETCEGKPGREMYENELMICTGLRSMRRASRSQREAALVHFRALKPLTRRPYTPAQLEAIHNASSIDELLGL